MALIIHLRNILLNSQVKYLTVYSIKFYDSVLAALL